MANKIKVGFIGLNPDGHWACNAHYPALKFLSNEFDVIGVANSSKESALRTAKELGLSRAFASPEELVTSNEIDLVVVTVKVPHHFELVSAAIESGKHVHCEWPLGNGLQEAEKLTRLAKEKGVHATVGTQMRTSPDLIYIAKLVKEGYVGEVLSTSLLGDGGNWGAETVDELVYLTDGSKGATMLTIPFGHTLAGLTDALGNITQVTGRLIQRRDHVYVTDTGKTVPTSCADQIMAHGTLENGAAFSVHYRGGLSHNSNFLWEINGTDGDIQVKGNIGHGQFAELAIFGAKNEDKELRLLTPPRELLEGLPRDIIPRNVAGVYRLIAEDIKNNSHHAPGFEDALKIHRILDAITKQEPVYIQSC